MEILCTTGCEVSSRYRVRDRFQTGDAHSRIGMSQTATINKGNFTFDLGTHVNSCGLVLIVLQLLGPSEHRRKADLGFPNLLYCDQAATRDCDCGEARSYPRSRCIAFKMLL